MSPDLPVVFGDSLLADTRSATHAVATPAWLASQGPVEGKETKPEQELLWRERGHIQNLS